MGKGGQKSETSKQAPTRKTKAAVDRRQNKRMLRQCSSGIAQRPPHHAIAVPTAMQNRVTMSVAPPLGNNWSVRSPTLSLQPSATSLLFISSGLASSWESSSPPSSWSRLDSVLNINELFYVFLFYILQLALKLNMCGCAWLTRWFDLKLEVFSEDVVEVINTRSNTFEPQPVIAVVVKIKS